MAYGVFLQLTPDEIRMQIEAALSDGDGAVRSVRLSSDMETGKSRGFGTFVLLYDGMK